MIVALTSDRVDLADGTYAGTWSAYSISIIGHPGVHLATVDGVRSLDGQPVSIVVRAGRATVTEVSS